MLLSSIFQRDSRTNPCYIATLLVGLSMGSRSKTRRSNSKDCSSRFQWAAKTSNDEELNTRDSQSPPHAAVSTESSAAKKTTCFDHVSRWFNLVLVTCRLYFCMILILEIGSKAISFYMVWSVMCIKPSRCYNPWIMSGANLVLVLLPDHLVLHAFVPVIQETWYKKSCHLF